MAKGGKQPGAGRPAGAKNANSPDIKILARKYANTCIEQLAKIAVRSKTESNRLAAIHQLLDRGFGKPTQQMSVDPDMPTGKITVSWEK